MLAAWCVVVFADIVIGFVSGEDCVSHHLHVYIFMPQYDRYQPSYQRLVNDEIPDTAAPPDGRFWKAGISQGVTTNPYEKSISLSGHRKPIVVGPRSISVVVDGEGHSLANVVRDVAWTRCVSFFFCASLSISSHQRDPSLCCSLIFF